MSVYKIRYAPMTGLIEKLKENGSNLHSFSCEVGIPYISVYRWARGVSRPSLENCKRMAVALNCTIDDLMGE